MEDTQTGRAMLSEVLLAARRFGADSVGTASVEMLKNGCSERLFPNMKDHSRDHFAAKITTGLPHGAVFWEEDAKTAIVYGVAHPEDQPEMDWWCGGIDPPGNKKLASIGTRLKEFLEERFPGIHVYPKMYHVEKGGVYLKEAAFQAGLGTIGRNNLLITPEFGAKIRFRAMLIDRALPQTGPSSFDPCEGCSEPCRKACPQHYFEQKIYSAEETGLPNLPARDGAYYRLLCVNEMTKNENDAQVQILPQFSDEPLKVTKYCRCCEMACPIGRRRKERS